MYQEDDPELLILWPPPSKMLGLQVYATTLDSCLVFLLQEEFGAQAWSHASLLVS